MASSLKSRLRDGSRVFLRVLLVDDDQEDSFLLSETMRHLPDFEIDFTWTNDIRDALRLIRDNVYDVHFVDYRLGHESGMSLLSRIIEEDPTRAVVLITGYGDDSARVECLRRGAVDYLAKCELDEKQLYRCIKRSLAPVEERGVHDRRLQREMFDDLTGVYRLSTFLGAARQELAASRGSSDLQALLIVDVDNYQDFVARKGAKAGDEVLRLVSGAIQSALPRCDIIGRYGLDKFCVLAPVGQRWMAEELAEHIRAGVERNAGVTASVGVACAPCESARINDLISNADAAKYNAQQEGRNRIHVIWRR